MPKKAPTAAAVTIAFSNASPGAEKKLSMKAGVAPKMNAKRKRSPGELLGFEVGGEEFIFNQQVRRDARPAHAQRPRREAYPVWTMAYWDGQLGKRCSELLEGSPMVLRAIRSSRLRIYRIIAAFHLN